MVDLVVDSVVESSIGDSVVDLIVDFLRFEGDTVKGAGLFLALVISLKNGDETFDAVKLVISLLISAVLGVLLVSSSPLDLGSVVDSFIAVLVAADAFKLSDDKFKVVATVVAVATCCTVCASTFDGNDVTSKFVISVLISALNSTISW